MPPCRYRSPPARPEPIGVAAARIAGPGRIPGEGRRAGEVGVVIADDELLREMNRALAGAWTTPPTSSASLTTSTSAMPRRGRVCGDVLISLDRAAAQAKRYRVTPGRELARPRGARRAAPVRSRPPACRRAGTHARARRRRPAQHARARRDTRPRARGCGAGRGGEAARAHAESQREPPGVTRSAAHDRLRVP